MFKRWLSLLLASLMLVCNWNIDVQAQAEKMSNQETYVIDDGRFGSTDTQRKAMARAGYTISETSPTGIAYAVDDGIYTHMNNIRGILSVDGKVAYCIEPMVNITSMDGYYIISLGDYTKLTEAQLNYINKIMIFGYQYSGHQTNRYYMATQFMIWEYLGYRVRVNEGFRNTGRNEGKPLTDVVPTGRNIDLSYEKAQIQALIDGWDTKPSFDATSITLKKGQSTTLIDSNGILEKMSVTSNGGLTVTQNGNSVTITANTDLENATIEFERTDINPDYVAPYLYAKSGSQTVEVGGTSDPTFASVTVKIDQKGNLNIKKEDDAKQSIPNVTFKVGTNLNGTEGTDWNYYTTGTDGIAHITFNDWTDKWIWWFNVTP